MKKTQEETHIHNTDPRHQRKKNDRIITENYF